MTAFEPIVVLRVTLDDSFDDLVGVLSMLADVVGDRFVVEIPAA